MKKNPIDELFASQLQNHEVAPSERARVLFQQRLNERNKQKPVVMFQPKRIYWAAAASIAVALSAGLWISQGDQTTQQVAANLPTKISTPRTEITIKPILKTNDVVMQPSAIQRASIKNKAVQLVEEKVENQVIDTNLQLILDEPIKDELTVAVLNAQEREKEARVAANNKASQIDLFQNGVGETIIVIAEVEPEEEQFYIPEISEDSHVTVAQAETVMNQKDGRTFVAKVLKEIKHLKHGEKVDINGLNQSPAMLFVRSEEGFIETERREIQDRWNRIRNIFN